VLLLHLPVALHLLDDELRVPDELDIVRSKLFGQLDAEQQGAVLGDVVGGLPDGRAALGEDLARGVRGDGGNGRRSWITPGTAVDVDDNLQARTSSPDFASEITFWARCEGISSWRANSIV
jgi:hypothetical protein